jgi:phosphoribosylglycinamide formyltransferase-1
MMARYKLVLIGSTGGGVFSKIARHSFVREMSVEAVSDRDCGFLSVADSFGIQSVKIASSDGHSFSDALYQRYRDNHDVIFLSFYTRLLKGVFLQKNKGRIFNCHPSILPSFKGMRGFEDTLDSSCTFMGSTLHMIDEGMDTGTSIIQAAIPLDRALPIAENRHKIFLSQYYSTLQFLRWLDEGRLVLHANGGFLLSGERFCPSIFSPNLDSDFFEFIGETDGLN